MRGIRRWSLGHVRNGRAVRAVHQTQDFNAFTLEDPSDLLPGEVLLCLSRGALSICVVDESRCVVSLKSWVASEICEIGAKAARAGVFDVVTLKLKSNNAPFAFHVDSANAVVDAWHRLNSEASGGDAGRARGDAELFKEGEAIENAPISAPLANHRVLVYLWRS